MPPGRRNERRPAGRRPRVLAVLLLPPLRWLLRGLALWVLSRLLPLYNARLREAAGAEEAIEIHAEH